MSAAAMEVVPERDLEVQANGWLERAQQAEITSFQVYEELAACLQVIKGLQNKAAASFDPIIRKALDTYREALDQKKKVKGPLETAESVIKSKLGRYTEEQERLLREEERKLQAEADLLAAAARAAEITEAEYAGASAEEVQSIAAAPLPSAPVFVQRQPQVAGLATREIWKAETTDLLALVRYVAANPQYLNLLKCDTVALQGLARSLKSALKMPGVKVWKENNIAVTNRR